MANSELRQVLLCSGRRTNERMCAWKRWEHTIIISRIEVRISLSLNYSIHDYTSYYNNNNNMWESIGGARIQWDHNGYSIIKIIFTHTHARLKRPKRRRRRSQNWREENRRCVRPSMLLRVFSPAYSSLFITRVHHLLCDGVMWTK